MIRCRRSSREPRIRDYCVSHPAHARFIRCQRLKCYQVLYDTIPLLNRVEMREHHQLVFERAPTIVNGFLGREHVRERFAQELDVVSSGLQFLHAGGKRITSQQLESLRDQCGAAPLRVERLNLCRPPGPGQFYKLSVLLRGCHLTIHA